MRTGPDLGAHETRSLHKSAGKGSNFERWDCTIYCLKF